MGVRKYIHKPTADLDRRKASASQPTSKRPWLTGEQNLAYLAQPLLLRKAYVGRAPLSKLPDSYTGRYYLKPLKLYRGQLKEAQEYSTA